MAAPQSTPGGVTARTDQGRGRRQGLFNQSGRTVAVADGPVLGFDCPSSSAQAAGRGGRYDLCQNSVACFDAQRVRRGGTRGPAHHRCECAVFENAAAARFGLRDLRAGRRSLHSELVSMSQHVGGRQNVFPCVGGMLLSARARRAVAARRRGDGHRRVSAPPFTPPLEVRVGRGRLDKRRRSAASRRLRRASVAGPDRGVVFPAAQLERRAPRRRPWRLHF